MLLLFETLKIEDGKIFNVKWHNKRLNKSRKELFNLSTELDLLDYLTSPPSLGLYRCKVIYNETILSVEYFPYQAKLFKNFQIRPSQIRYDYKYLNREELESLKNNPFDDVIIEKEGFLTDTSIANIAFYDRENWLTPKTPLLEGTTRARLLQKGFLKASPIKKEMIKNYTYFALMNSMIGFSIQKSVYLTDTKGITHVFRESPKQ
ncbi:MAG TPA: hypothetical protein ENK82_08170 [Campylobacterales bacterium]|nr:hypothetical protein [Campylobacterales bacterium]HHS93309.1 hypothetical protein [Campylobacterales bacterium]